MEDISLIDKFKILIDIILSSPLFLICITIGIASIVFFIICNKKNIKISKWIFIGIWILLLVTLCVVYNKVFIGLLDNLVNYIFSALYFPNLAVYVGILIITNTFFIISIFSKKMNKSHKIINFISAILLNILLIFILDIVNKEGIDVYEKLNVFTNSNLLVLLELSTGIFTSWILLNLFISAKDKLKRYDKKELPEMPDIIFN